MSNIVDLNLFDDETITFKIGQKKIEIPCYPKTSVVIKMMKLEERATKSKSNEEQVTLLADTVAMILSQGQEDVTNSFVKEHFSIKQMERVVKSFQESMRQIEKDPN